MDTITVINEILYILSAYEKGKIRYGGFWKNKQHKLFLESINIMELLLDFLSNPEKQQSGEKMLFILDFIDKNTNTIFPKSEKLNILKNKGFILKIDRNAVIMKQRKVIDIMRIIIKKCKTEKNTKTVYCLLMAFHNLPRVFFESNSTPLFNCSIIPITSQDALELAMKWLKKGKVTIA